MGNVRDEVNELIGQIYDAAMQPERWPATLERLGQMMGGAVFVMSALHRSHGMLLGATTTGDASATQIRLTP